MPSTPDWSWHFANPDERHYTLDSLRTSDPILWALILGHRNSRRIARALGMPYTAVLYELRHYKKLHLAHDEQAPSSIVWKLDDPHHLALKDWVTEMRKADMPPAIDEDAGES